MIRFLAYTAVVALVSAECPNGCSSHGKCTAYDMCLCYRNWMSNDCSERVCQFGLAHVDTPKGDLDASSGELSGPDDFVAVNSEMYPYGTTEQFPAMMAGDAFLENTAHYYMECSNKGICDRSAGVCECFPGYEGSACQRASCPSSGGSVCSGHGTCETIKQIAARDFNNIYELWDQKSTMGCVCDPGYYGSDCALRECKYGADPMYFDDNSNIRYSNWTVLFASDSTSGSGYNTLYGTFTIRFFDHMGEDWETLPISANAECAEIVTALENIPNDVIPDGSVRCRKFESANPDYSLDFYGGTNLHILSKFTIMFPENPGLLKEIQINKYLDGMRPSMYTGESDSSLTIFVYADGFHGEDIDLVPDECEDVIISFTQASITFNSLSSSYYTLSFSDGAYMIPLLKRCLGNSDNRLKYTEMADDVYNWDYGSAQNPHLVKFIDATTKPLSRICHSVTDFAYVDPTHFPAWCFENSPAGFYAPVIYDDNEDEFVVFSNAPFDYELGVTTFRVFTTTGHLQRVSFDAEVYNSVADTTTWQDFHSNVVYTFNRGSTFNGVVLDAIDSSYPYDYRDSDTEWGGNVDCETYEPRELDDGDIAEDCLQKGDYVMFFTTEYTSQNYDALPKYHNMYQVEKIHRAYPRFDTPHSDVEEVLRNRIVLNMHTNFNFALSATASTTDAVTDDVRLRAYKFYPPTTEVRYVEQCSGRGLCNTDDGLCECFPGYTNDDCSVQNAAAK
jgi:hypothetical protein